MIFRFLEYGIEVKDDDFDSIYPENIKKLSDRHWTSIDVAKKAATFLSRNGSDRILDIGSGVGKFCLVGASCTDGHFVGVEQRKHLNAIAEKIKIEHNVENASFINANILEINFSEYNGFYFFNPFYENIDKTAMIDDKVELDIEYYIRYTMYIMNELKNKPPGTRLVTYWGNEFEVPSSYMLLDELFDGRLKFWEKR